MSYYILVQEVLLTLETNIEIYSKNDKKPCCSCLWVILAIIGSILTFFIGLLVGATTSIIEGLTTPVIISLVIILIVLLIISIINVICCKAGDKKKKYYC